MPVDATLPQPAAASPPGPPTGPPPAYPVTLDAALDQPSRGLWLIKWLLLVPHYVVLAFLMIGMVVVWVAAFFAILFTGRYPRPLFDYTVGVLRWFWRVGAYGYGLAGTDRYPPFTLADVPDYPAHLDVAYPERLSRGLVLVKWWLLAIPHYLVTGLLLGGAIRFGERGDDATRYNGPGVIGLLVLVAVVVLLFRGTYPRPLFDLITGLQRWCYRVAGYSLLLTDAYPPFRLDLGGDDPGSPRRTTPAAETVGRPEPMVAVPAGPEPSARPAPNRWTAGRLVALIAGALLVLVSGGLLVGAATTAVADRTARDANGYLVTGPVTLSTTGYAIRTEAFRPPEAAPAWAQPSSTLGTVRARVTSTDPGRPLFLGVARRADVDRYLAGVDQATLRTFDGSTPVYDVTAGDAVPAAPGDQPFWISRAEGTGPIEVTWSADESSWVVVLMRADATPGVRATSEVGATLPLIGRITTGLTVGGLVVLALGAGLMVLTFASSSAARPGTETRTETPVG